MVRLGHPDTLVRRFVAILDTGRDVACPLAPFPLDFEEVISGAPNRTVRYIVHQPDGTSLTRDSRSP